jgi:hypothetical protein
MADDMLALVDDEDRYVRVTQTDVEHRLAGPPRR